MSEQTSLLEFPCVFPIKAMGRADEGFSTLVSTIVFAHAEPYPGEAVTVRDSGEGNFQSVTVTIVANSREQLDRIYQDLTDCEQVLMAL
jgi:putative lipoic acid-binding regulatory protein